MHNFVWWQTLSEMVSVHYKGIKEEQNGKRCNGCGTACLQGYTGDDRVRVLESRMKPGQKTDMHSHPALVAIGISDGKYNFTLPDGGTAEVELKAGEAIFADAVEHATENLGSSEGCAILVELK